MSSGCLDRKTMQLLNTALSIRGRHGDNMVDFKNLYK